MKALERAIDRPLPTFLVAIMVALCGSWAPPELPVKRAPEVQAPYSVVFVPYVGATAEEVESEVTLELEEELEKLGMTVVDTLPAMRAHHAAGETLYGNIDSHLSAAGHGVVAEVTAPAAAAAFGYGARDF